MEPKIKSLSMDTAMSSSSETLRAFPQSLRRIVPAIFLALLFGIALAVDASAQVPQADLSVTKQVVNNGLPTFANPTVTFEVSVTNLAAAIGATISTGFSVDDALPNGMTFAASLGCDLPLGPGGSVGAGGSGFQIVYDANLQLSETLTCGYTANVAAPFDAGADYTNTAGIIAANETDNDSGNNSDSAIVLPTYTDVALSHVVNWVDLDNKLVRITFTVTNQGTRDATDVEVTTDDFDIFMSSANTGIAQFISTTKGAITGNVWAVGSLPSGEVESITLEAPLDVQHTFVGGARITGMIEFDSDSGNDEVGYTIGQYDYGDLPDSYGTLAGSAGPTHQINADESPRLGVLVDSENDGQPSIQADDDDDDAIANDEDGVEIETVLGMGFQALTSLSLPLRSSVGYHLQFIVRGLPGTYYVSAFMDRNADGDFDLPEEAYFLNQEVTVGAMGFATFIPNDLLLFDIPTYTNVAYMRVRVCDSDANECDTPGGFVDNGEVEDYFVAVNQADLFDFGDAPELYSDITVFPVGPHHRIGGIRLGSKIDGEYDAVPSIDADGDGDDEDGITFLSLPFVEGGTAHFIVEASGTAPSGFLNAWVDFNRDGDLDDPGEYIVVDERVYTGVSEVLNFAVPDNAILREDVLARFRLCTNSAQCNSPIGLAVSGEVEDYVVQVGDESDTFVINADNNLLTSPISVSSENGILRIVDSSLPTPHLLFSAPLLKVGKLAITANELILDYTTGDPLPQEGISFVGVGDNATLRILAGDFAGPISSIEHVYDNDHDGSIEIDGRVISYENLAPIIDLLPANTRIFTYPGTETEPKQVVLTPDGDGASDNGVSFIECIDCGEETTFANPLEDMFINTGSGADQVLVSLLDDAVPGGFEMLTIDVGDGADYVLVAPSADYEYAIHGGTPPITPGECPADADVLEISFSGVSGGTSEYTDIVAGDGNWTFSDPHQPITFTGFERQASADSHLRLLVTPDIVYPTQATELLVIASNTGSAAAKCVSVIVPPEILTLVDANPGTFPVASAPIVISATDENGVPIPALTVTYNGVTGVLSLPVIEPGHEYRMTIDLTSVVNWNLMPETWEIELFHGAESQAIAPFEASRGFLFPVKTHVNAATFLDERELTTYTGGGTATSEYEQLVVGLFQGSPNMAGAVWCRIPTAADVSVSAVWNPPAGFNGAPGESRMWRPCSGADIPDDPTTPNVDESIDEGALPFPLHVNGLLATDLSTPFDPFDSSRRLWLATWGSAGLYYSDDDAETWHPAWPETGPGNADKANYWTLVYAITKDAGGFLYASANAGHIIRSLDNGDSWQEMGPLPHAAADTPWSLTAHPTVPGIVYAGTFGRGVLVSLDFGFSWKELDETANEKLYNRPQGESAGHIFDLTFGPINDEYLYAATGSGVWRARFHIDATDDIDGDWQLLGPEVSHLSGNTVVATYPEVRALAFRLNPDPELVIGTWGRFEDDDGDLVSAFTLSDPFELVPIEFAGFKLRTSQINFIVTSATGAVFLGSADGILYNLAAAEPAATATANEAEATLPTRFELHQNYPNPFNPVTTIRYAVPESGRIRLAVFDMLGREVALLVNSDIAAGQHEVQFDAKRLPSGSYIYRMDTTQGSIVRRLVLLK
jgi:GEVED domain/Domain of unknown function DUF11/Secretion system C-terminal sorting domain